MFALNDCPKFEEIEKIVEAQGGVLKTRWQQGMIHLALADPNSALPFPKPADHPVYSYHFILDSVHLRELQDLEAYELEKQQVEEPQELAPLKEVKCRSKFTVREEGVMKEYMRKYPGSYTSFSYWNKAIASGINLNRSANTLKDHAKQILQGKSVAESERREQDGEKRPGTRPQTSTVKKAKIRIVEQNTEQTISLSRPVHYNPSSPIYQRQTVPSSIASVRAQSPKISVPPFSPQKSPGSQPPSRLSTPMKRGSDSVISELMHSPVSLSSRFDNSPALRITLNRSGQRTVKDMEALRRKCMNESIPEKFIELVTRCQQKSRHPVEEKDVLNMLLRTGGNARETEAHFARN